MSEEQKFKVGDIVEAFGVEGAVTGINEPCHYPVAVYFAAQDLTKDFTADGRACDWHKEPSLKLISRPKKKEKRVLKGWVNVYPFKEGYRASDYHTDRASADRYQSANRYACVELTGEYEVEVEG